ncbi:HEAT repeat family protein [Trichomonas vaginalis G3]|uniref:HEAT repeat family protein n=1 Tax=Trichomonas vaginalis (strain ATCC PRA-98 / G3) TaxID=412133 RepID=A2DQ32_TRIV3|nr:meiotic spindle elongation [Trichomonas vaginalis G3]EAY17459.1 HEAT repeat family protein [Trichomonas vaginalis G3]KAI5533565.1 meiotic spindle elongation [Trichomonas vaginalis G3]|eukprot:XP_001329594.1 HEAT repeat family protein [Trichomonas vaginalis G3]
MSLFSFNSMKHYLLKFRYFILKLKSNQMYHIKIVKINKKMSRQQADPAFVLNFFTEELNSDNVHHRLFAASNIQLVAAAMGAEHARTELVQFLMNANQLDGEVQMILADNMGNLVKYVGGPEYASSLLGPLKILASAEEAIVRDKAIDSMNSVCNAIPAASADNFLMTTARDLATAEFFTARASASAFIVRIYDKLSETNKTSVRQIYKSLVKDETPMVRRSALKYLPQLCELLPANIIVSEIAKDILMGSVNDDEDSVRLLLPSSLSVISAKLGDSDRLNIIVSLGKMIVKDGSWRVRSAFATEIPAIAKPFSPDVIVNEICPILFRLLHDPEAEAKTAACKATSGMLPLLSKQENFVIEKVIPELSSLTNDGSPTVRREVALHIMELAPIVGKQHVSQSIIPLFGQILHDTDNEASVALLTSLLQHVEEVDMNSIVPAVLPTILEIANDAHWRVIVAIIKLIPSFAAVLGTDEFGKKLFPLVQNWLTFQFFAVRDTMTQQLGLLVQEFGSEWATQTLVPFILQLKTRENYLIRQVTLMCISRFHGYMPINSIVKYFLPTVLYMSNDRTPNVKFMVAKTLLLFLGANDQKVTQQVSACLKTLSNDPDTDVKYYACMALLKCQ